MACKEERGECVIFQWKKQLLGSDRNQMGKTQKREAETRSAKKDIRGEMCSQGRGADTPDFLPVAMDHVSLSRNVKDKQT
jgi:hypothetical protein